MNVIKLPRAEWDIILQLLEDGVMEYSMPLRPLINEINYQLDEQEY